MALHRTGNKPSFANDHSSLLTPICDTKQNECYRKVDKGKRKAANYRFTPSGFWISRDEFHIFTHCPDYLWRPDESM